MYELPIRLVALVRKNNKDAELAQLQQVVDKLNLEEYLNTQSLNQVLIQCNIERDKNNNIPLHPLVLNTETWQKAGYYDPIKGILKNKTDEEMYYDRVLELYKHVYEKNKPFKGIVVCITTLKSDDEEGGESKTVPLDSRLAIILGSNIEAPDSYAHEIGHLLGLEHIYRSKEDLEDLQEKRQKIIELNNKIGINKERQKKYIDDCDKYKAKNGYDCPERKEVVKKFDNEIDNQKIESKLCLNVIQVYKENKYCFGKESTINFMDYTKDHTNRHLFCKWQWELMQRDIVKYYGKVQKVEI